MTQPIEDISNLPGTKLSDQSLTPIGEVKDVYTMEDGFPMWVGVEVSAGMADKRMVVVPLARLKDENGDLCVPYSKSHILEAPEVDADDGISAECDQALRGFYGIGVADQEMWSDNKGYATLVTEESGEAERVDDPESLDTPDADKHSDETRERVQDPGSSEIRQVDAEDVVAESTGDKEKAVGEKPDGDGDSEQGDPD